MLYIPSKCQRASVGCLFPGIPEGGSVEWLMVQVYQVFPSGRSMDPDALPVVDLGMHYGLPRNWMLLLKL